MDTSWEEIRGPVEEMIRSLGEDGGEREVLAELSAIQKGLEESLGEQQEKVTVTLQKMQERLATAEEGAARSGEIAALRQQMEEVDKQRAAVGAALEGMLARRDASAESVRALKAQVEATLEAFRKAREEQERLVPHAKQSMRLYATISHIRWDFEADSVRGYVAPPGETAEPTHFDFDPDKEGLGAVQVADRLWANIAAATGNA